MLKSNLRKIKDLRVSNWRIFGQKNAGSYFCINTNIKGDFQICISVPLTLSRRKSYIETNPFAMQIIRPPS